jgi:dephospho-CoA kinase
LRQIGCIVGLPGSGKSEFCRIAREEHSCQVLSFDDLLAMPALPELAGPAGQDASGRLTNAALADRWWRARALLPSHGTTILDSFPKGRPQAEIVSELVGISFIIVVRADEHRCRERAMRRSPERFSRATIDKKFAERRRQTQEVEDLALARGIQIHELENIGDLERYRLEAARILTNLQISR